MVSTQWDGAWTLRTNKTAEQRSIYRAQFFSTSSIPWEANILKEMNITFLLSTVFYIEQTNLHIKTNTTIKSFDILLSKIKKKTTFPK